MRKELITISGKGMLRWLLLALLFAGVTAETFQEPRSIYRIEEVFSSKALSQNEGIYAQAFHEKHGITSGKTYNKNLQSQHFRILSITLSKLTACAISNAPHTLSIVRKATGQLLKSKSLSSDDDFISLA